MSAEPALALDAANAAHEILGIDPGKYGALALYDPETRAAEIADIPLVGPTGKQVIDEYALARWIDARSHRIGQVWLEQVSSRPGEGHVGAFSFGRTYGLIRGVCVANFLSIYNVTPATWKAALKVSKDKDMARLSASAAFPRLAHNWPLKKHDGRAEALLIAHYGSLQRR